MMTPTEIPVSAPTSSSLSGEPRPSKKVRVDISSEDEAPAAICSHPLGVKPSGNAYTASVNSKSHTGLFSKLPDEILMILLECLDADPLITLGSTCKALYAFTRADELWRDLFVQSKPTDFTWNGTWRSTYLRKPQEVCAQLDCSNVFSDVLHRPFFCAHTPLNHYAQNIPPQNRITRLTDLTEADFTISWTNKPFILTSPIKQWPIYQNWNTTSLLAQYADTSFRAEAVDWPLKTYISYMRSNADESPLYLFDRSFDTKMGIEVGTSPSDPPSASYWPPLAFGSDYFSILGAQRPDRRWLIVGPARSGSTFHKDPNATSAWNAVLTGAKYWLMFPSAPPGILLSADGAEITAPLSIAEYLLGFHELARRTPGCVEAICHAGEVLHVPSGWFHLVLNLDEGVAVTQNFVPRSKVPDVLSFLKDTPEQVTGFRKDVEDPYRLFVERLGEEHPDVLKDALEVLERRDKRKNRWEQITKGTVKKVEDGAGFSFGFGGDDDDNDEDEDTGQKGGFSFGFGGDSDEEES